MIVSTRNILLSLFALILVNNCGNQPTSQTSIVQKDSVDVLKDQFTNDSLLLAVNDSLRRNDSLIAVENAKRLKVLKSKFLFKKDEIKGGGWYVHRNQTVDNSYNRNYLDAPVNDSGYIYLRSNYYGDDWIFHTKVIVRIDNKVLESETIPTYSDEHHTSNGSGSVWETISFTSDRDNGILTAIANHEVKNVLVRYEGEYQKTFQLSSRDIKAIRDSYELSVLLKKE